ncbi:hypothetical protein ACOMHN_045313 [Nucella lapillus]
MEIGVLSGFWLVSSAVLVVSYFIDQHPSAPNVWRSLLRWGKMRVGVVVGTNYFYEVPKRWFQHFYMLGILVNSLVLFLLYRKLYMREGEWPVFLTSFLEQLQHPAGSTGLTNAVPVLLTLTLELLQVMRRCYETFFVNNFSKHATMTLLHYILGLVFYLSISMCALTGTDFRYLHVPDAVSAMDGIAYAVAVVVFLSASLVQHQSFRILAALRTSDKDTQSKMKSTYLLPRGGLFDLVSCPHFLAEIVVYFSFCIIFRFQNFVLISLFIFILVNQVLAALLNHQWYCQNFPGFGKHRHAVFPYLL